jgi:UDP-N-acetylmuramoylalanine--D-glutamate ligase
MGVDNAKLKREFADIVPVIYDCNRFEEAMEAARNAAEPGDTILLSPACASFDLFKNYEERGRMFKEWVANNILNK